MGKHEENILSVRTEIERLTNNGVLGFYTHFEVTEIIAFGERGSSPINVFSIFVAEDRTDVPSSDPEFLGSRIIVKSMKGWTFGVCRYVRTISEILDRLAAFQTIAKWCPSGNTLSVGALAAVPTQFVPADTTVIAPWNNVLKNNFWSGSYVVELASREKAALKPFFDDPPALQDVNRRRNGTPYRLAKGTPLSGCIGSAPVGPELSI